MIKAHKIQLNPTPEQEVSFRKAVGTARFVFNWALAEWTRHKAEHLGQAHGAMALKKDFNALKLEQFPWVYDVAKDVAEGAFTNLAAALTHYFDSKNGKRQGLNVGFPKFKSKKNTRQSFRLNNEKIQVDGHHFYVPKLGWVNMAEALRLEGTRMGAVVSRVGGRVVGVSPFYPSSQLCSTLGCTGRHTELKLEERERTCSICGAVHDRDCNAARNIAREALRMLGQPPVVATSGSRLVDGGKTARGGNPG